MLLLDMDEKAKRMRERMAKKKRAPSSRRCGTQQTTSTLFGHALELIFVPTCTNLARLLHEAEASKQRIANINIHTQRDIVSIGVTLDAHHRVPGAYWVHALGILSHNKEHHCKGKCGCSWAVLHVITYQIYERPQRRKMRCSPRSGEWYHWHRLGCRFWWRWRMELTRLCS
jgi:hypothetical protein